MELAAIIAAWGFFYFCYSAAAAIERLSKAAADAINSGAKEPKGESDGTRS
jgi:hypothetical protein